MQDEDLKKIIIERYNQLPKKIQDAIVDSNWEQKIRSMASKYNIVIGDAGTLETETFLVMLGLEEVSNYRKNITNNTDMPEETIDKVINDVNTEIFKEIKQYLIDLNEQEALIDASEEKNDQTKDTQSTIPTPDVTNANAVPTSPIQESVAKIETHEISDLEKSEEPSSSKSDNSPSEFDPYREPVDFDDMDI